MAAAPKQLHPAVQYLKANAVVIGLVLIVAVSVGVFALTQGAPKAESAAQVKPTAAPTAVLDSKVPIAGSGSPSAAPTATSGTPSSPTAPPGSEGAAQPSAKGDPSPVILGTAPQAVSAKDWRPYAKDAAAAWLNTAGGQKAWLDRLKPLVSAEMLNALSRTDIHNVPIDTLDGVSLGEESPGAKTFHAYGKALGPIFDGRLTIRVDGTWVVDQIGAPTK